MQAHIFTNYGSTALPLGGESWVVIDSSNPLIKYILLVTQAQPLSQNMVLKNSQRPHSMSQSTKNQSRQQYIKTSRPVSLLF